MKLLFLIFFVAVVLARIESVQQHHGSLIKLLQALEQNIDEEVGSYLARKPKPHPTPLRPGFAGAPFRYHVDEEVGSYLARKPKPIHVDEEVGHGRFTAGKPKPIEEEVAEYCKPLGGRRPRSLEQRCKATWFKSRCEDQCAPFAKTYFHWVDPGYPYSCMEISFNCPSLTSGTGRTTKEMVDMWLRYQWEVGTGATEGSCKSDWQEERVDPSQRVKCTFFRDEEENHPFIDEDDQCKATYLQFHNKEYGNNPPNDELCCEALDGEGNVVGEPCD